MKLKREWRRCNGCIPQRLSLHRQGSVSWVDYSYVVWWVGSEWYVECLLFTCFFDALDRSRSIIGQLIFSTAERISLSLAWICSTENSKSYYSKTRKINFFLPWREPYRPKLSIKGCGLLLRLRETNEPWLLYLREAPFLITLTKNCSLKSCGCRVPLIIPHRLINYYRPPF